MQYVNTCPVLNVEESDRLSFMPYLFGTDFMLAELQVYALAKKWMPEYEGGFWHFIRLPECLDKRPLNREFRGKLRRDPFPVLKHKLGVILGGMQRPAGVIKFVFVVEVG